MSIKQDSYCRLEHFCSLELGNKNLKPEKSLAYETVDVHVYVEEYDNFISVKNRILELTDLWLEKHPEQDLYPQFIVYNRFEDWKYVGVCYQVGWYVSITFFGTILDYLREKYGKEEGQRKYLREISKEMTFFMATQCNAVSTCELISEEIADILFKEWLDNGQMETEAKKELFMREINKRNY